MAVIYAGTHGLLSNVPLDKVHDFETQYLQALKMKYRKETLDVLATGKLTPEVEELLTTTAKEVADSIANSK